MQESPVEQLARASEACWRLVAAVRPDQWEAGTPCADWTVRELVEHLAAGNGVFAAALSDGGPPHAQAAGPAGSGGATGPGSDHGGDPVERYRASERALLAAFAAPGALDGMVTVPFGTVPAGVALHLRTVEALVHGWDVATATGQPPVLPDDLAEQELAFTKRSLAEVPPERSPFGAPQPVPEDAAAIDRLAGLLGRRSSPGPAA